MDPVAAVIVLVLAAWGAAELRRREAERKCTEIERQREALRGQVLKLLGEMLEHAEKGGNHLDRAAGMYDASYWLMPMFSEAQFGASRMRALERVAREAIQAIGGEDGIRGKQEDRV